MLAVVIGVVIYFTKQDQARNIAQPFDRATTQTQPDTIGNSSDLVKVLGSQADEEFDYFQGLDDESSLTDNDALELNNVSKAYEENDF